MRYLKQKQSLYLFILTIIVLGFYGCPGGDPKISLEVTDCEKDKITIEHDTKVTPRAGEQWTLRSTITIKCDGVVVPNADIKVEFWWPGGEYKKTTNQDGKAVVTKKGHGDPPRSKKFTVIIIGNDGEREVEFETPAN